MSKRKHSSLPKWARRGQAGWEYTGEQRPPFAEPAGPGQESVWDYPRPPRLQLDARLVVVRWGEVEIARSQRALRLLETASPPTFYLPETDVEMALLEPVAGASHCEWKGEAGYFDVVSGDTRLTRAAWSYRQPFPPYGDLAGYLSFYPAALECLVAGERVQPQPGGFYGGWVTSELVGPFKGEPGTGGW